MPIAVFESRVAGAIMDDARFTGYWPSVWDEWTLSGPELVWVLTETRRGMPVQELRSLHSQSIEFFNGRQAIFLDHW